MDYSKFGHINPVQYPGQKGEYGPVDHGTLTRAAINWKGDAAMITDGPPIGIELEMGFPSIRARSDAIELCHAYDIIAYEDGSIPWPGAELVSSPRPILWYYDSTGPYAEFVNKIAALAHTRQTTGTGCHINLGVSSLTGLQVEQLVALVGEEKQIGEYIADRTGESYNQFNKKLKTNRNRFGAKGEACCGRSIPTTDSKADHTRAGWEDARVEFRLFRSTTDHHQIQRYLEYVYSTYLFIQTVSKDYWPGEGSQNQNGDTEYLKWLFATPADEFQILKARILDSQINKVTNVLRDLPKPAQRRSKGPSFGPDSKARAA